jgi:hypothetical protein
MVILWHFRSQSELGVRLACMTVIQSRKLLVVETAIASFEASWTLGVVGEVVVASRLPFWTRRWEILRE